MSLNHLSSSSSIFQLSKLRISLLGPDWAQPTEEVFIFVFTSADQDSTCSSRQSNTHIQDPSVHREKFLLSACFLVLDWLILREPCCVFFTESLCFWLVGISLIRTDSCCLILWTVCVSQSLSSGVFISFVEAVYVLSLTNRLLTFHSSFLSFNSSGIKLIHQTYGEMLPCMN